jgi:hypothetical protein
MHCIAIDEWIGEIEEELSMHILMSRLFWFVHCWSPPLEN